MPRFRPLTTPRLCDLQEAVQIITTTLVMMGTLDLLTPNFAWGRFCCGSCFEVGEATPSMHEGSALRSNPAPAFRGPEQLSTSPPSPSWTRASAFCAWPALSSAISTALRRPRSRCARQSAYGSSEKPVKIAGNPIRRRVLSPSGKES